MTTDTRMTVERFFGGVPGRMRNLEAFLEYIDTTSPTREEVVAWLQANTTADDVTTIQRNLSFLETIELITLEDTSVSLTNKGTACWRAGEPAAAYYGLARNVNGITTAVRAIRDGNHTPSAIQTILQDTFPDFELPLGVVTKHLSWLQSLGAVDVDADDNYHLPIADGFEVGARYSRWYIHDVYKGGRYSGISTPSDYPMVFLFTGDSGESYGYADEFRDDGSFLYTGEGTEGDMTMTGGNSAIRDHAQHGETLHVFEATDLPWIVTYVGEYEYVTHRDVTLPDETGADREAFRFELQPAGGSSVVVDGPPLSDLSLSGLFDAAKSASPTMSSSATSPGDGERERRVYERADVVKEFAKAAADGVCQGCLEPAPFVDQDREPFLEVHHLTRRSDGGADDPENVIAICPNCHRRVHYGKDGDSFNETLQARAADRNAAFTTHE